MWCESATSHKSHLREHISAVHANMKIFKCEQCEYATIHKGHLKRHVSLVHCKVKTFKCELCEFITSKKGYLKQHVSALHGKVYCQRSQYSEKEIEGNLTTFSNMTCVE